MDTSAILSAYGSTAAQAATSTQSTSGSNLNMDDFFQLLAAQLQYQDPTEPTDNSQFMAQMAQFSMLEQLQNLSKSFNVSLASQTVGRTVIYNTTDAQGNAVSATGVVQAVDLTGSDPLCYINGEWVKISNVTTVYDASASGASTSDASSSGGSSGTGTSAGNTTQSA